MYNCGSKQTKGTSFMNDTIEALRNWGCDIDGAMERFDDDVELFLSFLPDIVNEPAVVKLGEDLKSGNVSGAFDCAHLIKGLLGNMGITPLYEIAIRLVEPLRHGSDEGLLPIYEEFMQAHKEFTELVCG